MAIVSLGCVVIGSILFLTTHNASEQAVAGITTTVSDISSKQTMLTCGQCLKQTETGKQANLCFHQDGNNSYAQCQNGAVEINQGNNTTCVRCGLSQCTPRPTITCTQGQLTSETVSGSCTQSNSFHFVTYTCSDGSSGTIGNNNLCISADAWKTYVGKVCAVKKKCTPSVTPGAGGWCTPTPEPKPSVTPGCQTVCKPLGIACRVGFPCKQTCTKICTTPVVHPLTSSGNSAGRASE